MHTDQDSTCTCSRRSLQSTHLYLRNNTRTRTALVKAHAFRDGRAILGGLGIWQSSVDPLKTFSPSAELFGQI